MSCEEPLNNSTVVPQLEEKEIEGTVITEETVPIIELIPPKAPQTQPEPQQITQTVNSTEQSATPEKKENSQAPRCINKMIKTTRKPPYTSSFLTQADIAQEIIARAEKKRQTFPDAVDVFVALKSQSQIRVPNLMNEVQPPPPMPTKLPKIRDEEKCLDAKDLLLILQDGIDGNSGDQKLKTGPKPRSSRPKLDLKIDPDLERELALKQLMEFSSKKEKKSKNTNNNVDNSKTPKVVKQEKGENKEVKPKRKSTNSSNGPPPKRGSNRELQKLLQDEGAINMLYDIERGETVESKSRLSSKRRLQKVLKKKAQEVEEAILVATSSASSNSRSLRTSDKRKHSVDSVELDEPQEANAQFAFTAPAEASKIIRRHSSSSSYSSRGSSPRRMSVDRDQSPSSSESSVMPINNDSKDNQSSLTSSPAPRTPTTPLKTGKTEMAVEINDILPATSVNPNPRVKISERTEKLIDMKVRELNLQPHHGALIKQLILEKKNGLRERLQSEFAVKFKAALPKDQANTTVRSVPKSPGVKLNEGALAHLKEKTKNLVGVVESPNALSSKPAWKLVEEDWDSGEEGDPDSLPSATTPEKLPTLEKNKAAKSLEANINTIAETLVARIKAVMPLGAEAISKSHTKVPTPATTKYVSNELEHQKGQTEPQNVNENSDHLLPAAMPGPVPGSDVRLERINSVIRLYIKPTSCRLPNSLNCKVLNELTQALDYLQSSADTRVIVLVFPPLHDAMTAISDSENDDLEARGVLPDSSVEPTSPAFRSDIIETLPTDQINHCNGIDLLSLCAESADERRQIANETATAIKDLTLKLATCTRLVCTAVCGKAIGLSVVLLAYCDFVLADDSAVFFTPYSQLGYLPEAAGTHVLPHLIGRRKTSWLLLGNGSLTAHEAEVCGLITRVVKRKSLAHELNNLGRSLTNTSMLSSESTKNMMTQSMRSMIPNFLATEAKVLETHWSAPDTQHRMKNFAAQLVEESQQTEWNGRGESPLRASEEQTPQGREEQEAMLGVNFGEVPLQNLVFEQLKVEPLQPLDGLHFEDPTILELPRDDGEYKLQLLR